MIKSGHGTLCGILIITYFVCLSDGLSNFTGTIVMCPWESLFGDGIGVDVCLGSPAVLWLGRAGVSSLFNIPSKLLHRRVSTMPSLMSWRFDGKLLWHSSLLLHNPVMCCMGDLLMDEWSGLPSWLPASAVVEAALKSNLFLSFKKVLSSCRLSLLPLLDFLLLYIHSLKLNVYCVNSISLCNQPYLVPHVFGRLPYRSGEAQWSFGSACLRLIGGQCNTHL